MAADKLVDSTRLDNALEYTAQRIRVKSGSSENINFDLANEKGFGDAIDAIPTGGGSSEVEYKDVNFYGLNAELLYSYTLAEAQALTELPALPTDDVNGVPMTYDWVVTLNTINSLTSSNIPYNVCVAACPTDGKTHIHIELPEGKLSPYIGCCPNGTIEIDWGDGSANSTLTGNSDTTVRSVYHEYASVGEYEITINVISGKVTIKGTQNYFSKLLWSNIENSNYYDRSYSNSIKSIEIGNNVNLGEFAFYNCACLTSVTIPSGTTSFGRETFSSCYSLISLTVPSGVTSVANSMLNNCFSVTSVAIPSGVTSIGTYAFCYCYSLISLIIPKGVTSIGANVCNSCSSLTSVFIPSGVESLGQSSFSGCSALTSVTLSGPILYPNYDLFRNCYSLASIVIPNGMTQLGSSMFYGCRHLKSITLPNTITNIPSSTFNYCCSLASITIPSGVTTLKSSVLSNCYSLTSLTIPASVTTLESDSLNCLYGMGILKFESSTPPTASAARTFSYLPEQCKILVPQGSLSAYTSAANYPSSSTYTYEEY